MSAGAMIALVIMTVMDCAVMEMNVRMDLSFTEKKLMKTDVLTLKSQSLGTVAPIQQTTWEPQGISLFLNQ